MADNVPITAGTGTDIATDDNGGVHYQEIKIMAGADGTFTGDVGGRTVDGGSGAALYVDPRLNVATQSQDSSGLTTASTAYSIGDVLGAGWTFTSMARVNGGTGRITGAVLLDDGDVTIGVDLYIASASITFGTDNAAPSVSDTDAAKLVGIIGVGMIDIGSSRLGVASGLSVPYHCDATSLFVYARTLDAHTFFAAADDLHVRLYYELD